MQVKSVMSQLALAAPLSRQSRAQVGNCATSADRLLVEVEVDEEAVVVAVEPAVVDWAAAKAANSEAAMYVNCMFCLFGDLAMVVMNVVEVGR